jgi:membrane-associated phospholipid phosphatase
MFILLFVVSHVVAATNDLTIRFSKVSTIPQYNSTFSDLPLTSRHYPIQNATYNWLRYTTGTSVMTFEKCYKCYWSSERLIEMAGGPPFHPLKNSSSPYWKELFHVVKIQKLRRKGVDPKTIMPLPEAWKKFSIDDVAEAVHDEFLGIYHIEMISKWKKEKSIIMDRDIIPFVSAVDFLRSIILLGDMIMWAVARVGPYNFALKWHIGLARPEEVAFQIASRNLTIGPPKRLVRAIRSMKLEKATQFTAYPEGSPTHPSWPAMHSASCSASLWMPVVMKLTPQQLCQVQLTDYAISYARTVAGVHYPIDNMAGLKLGQEIVARLLPDYLSKRYGSSKAQVRKKIKSLRFNWDTFLDSDCAKGLI